jgi:hypothetical protein
MNRDSLDSDHVGVDRSPIPRRYPKKIFAPRFDRSRRDFAVLAHLCMRAARGFARAHAAMRLMQVVRISQGFLASAKNAR